MLAPRLAAMAVGIVIRAPGAEQTPDVEPGDEAVESVEHGALAMKLKWLDPKTAS